MKKIINRNTISTLLAILLASAMAYVMTFCFNEASTVMLANLGKMLIAASEKAIANHTTPAGMLCTIGIVAMVYAAMKVLFMAVFKNFGKEEDLDLED